MVFQRLATRLERPWPPLGPTHTKTGAGAALPAGVQRITIDSVQQATDERNLWSEAFGQLSHLSQLELESWGINSKGYIPLAD